MDAIDVNTGNASMDAGVMSIGQASQDAHDDVQSSQSPVHMGMENAGLVYMNRWRRYLARFCIFIAVASLLLSPVMFIRGIILGGWADGIVLAAICLLAAALSLHFARKYRRAPDVVGFSNDGIHFQYDDGNPASRPDFLAWNDIGRIGTCGRLSETSHLKNIELKDGTQVNVQPLPPSINDAMEEQFRRFQKFHGTKAYKKNPSVRKVKIVLKKAASSDQTHGIAKAREVKKAKKARKARKNREARRLLKAKRAKHARKSRRKGSGRHGRSGRKGGKGRGRSRRLKRGSHR